MTEQKIVFFDTETTGLHPARRIWDLGIIERPPGTDGDADVEHSIIVEDVDLSDADPFALKIGHFYERHPHFGGHVPERRIDHTWLLMNERRAAQFVEKAVRGATVVGAVPHFDEVGGKDLLRRYGMLWNAHYHLMDVENLVVGYLRGLGHAGACDLVRRAIPLDEWLRLLEPPWDSEALSRAVGVEPPGPAERHTALGDARWVKRIYDRVMYDGPMIVKSGPMIS